MLTSVIAFVKLSNPASVVLDVKFLFLERC